VEKEHVTFSVLDDWTAFEKFVLGNACNNEIIFRLDFDLVEGSSNSDLRCVFQGVKLLMLWLQLPLLSCRPRV